MTVATQSNSMPPGGVTATQPVVPAGQLTPADIQAITEALTPIQAQFRQQSTFMKVDLDQASWSTLGDSKSTKISNVGLAVRTITEWNVVFTIANSATVATSFSVSPLFPYNFIANTQISINGGAAVYSADGVSALAAMTRQRRGSRRLFSAGFGPALNPALVSITLGSNLTATNAAAGSNSFSGISSISVAASASSNNTVTVKFFTIEKLALDKDSLLGSLPLQNNSTFIQVARRIAGVIKAATRNDLAQPFYGSETSLTYTLTSCTADTTYEFASVPANAALYQPMITNSYQTIVAGSNTVSATGAGALKYDIPKNIYLVAAHLMAQDTNGAVVDGYNSAVGLGKLQLQYNAGSVTPVTQQAYRERAIQFLEYDYDPESFQGYRLWDGEATTDDVTASDNMGWLDAYYTASPQIVIDLASGISVPMTYAVLREAVVAGAVQTVGG
ncbi:MAG: hypothetical protein ACYCSN_13515 [Acidobacteriaceae bacterium]